MTYTKGDKIAEEQIIRRLRKRWIKDGYISHEAFSPRKFPDNSYEDGISVDIKRLLSEPIGNDKWSNHPSDPRGSGQLASGVPSACGYPVKFDGTSRSHCLISGDMSMLFEDDIAQRKMAKATALLHTPWN